MSSVPRDYRVVARLKNNRLWGQILLIFPHVKNQADAARALEVSETDIGKLLNMTIWPYIHHRQTWNSLAVSVATKLKETPDYLFDGRLYGQKPAALVLELDRPALESAGLLQLPERPDETLEAREDYLAVHTEIERLPPGMRAVVNEYFGLDTGAGRSTYKMAQDQGLSNAAVSQRLKRALRRLQARAHTDSWGRPTPPRVFSPDIRKKLRVLPRAGMTVACISCGNRYPMCKDGSPRAHRPRSGAVYCPGWRHPGQSPALPVMIARVDPTWTVESELERLRSGHRPLDIIIQTTTAI